MRFRPQCATAAAIPATPTPIIIARGGDPARLGLAREHRAPTVRATELLAPLSSVETVKLHHAIPLGEGRSATFDVATYAGGGLRHVLDRVAHGTKQAVEDFLARVNAAKRANGTSRDLAGAVLVAPRFSEEALAAYLGALRAARSPSLRSALELRSHREGFLSTEGGGCHVLLVEEQGGRRRPLVTEN